jgi:hypothetical protein
MTSNSQKLYITEDLRHVFSQILLNEDVNRIDCAFGWIYVDYDENDKEYHFDINQIDGISIISFFLSPEQLQMIADGNTKEIEVYCWRMDEN